MAEVTGNGNDNDNSQAKTIKRKFQKKENSPF